MRSSSSPPQESWVPRVGCVGKCSVSTMPRRTLWVVLGIFLAALVLVLSVRRQAPIRVRIRGFTDEERAFIMETFRDPRGWGVDVREDDVTPNVLLSKTSDTEIRSRFPDNVHGLSLTDRTTCPVHIHINKKNWDTPPTASRYTDRNAYRTYLLNHELGHAAGFEHPHDGIGPSPVMVPQSKGDTHYDHQPYPLDHEREGFHTFVRDGTFGKCLASSQ